MSPMGEFEQRPEVKPAEQMQLPKAKASPISWILCVVFALAALGLGGYIIFNKTDDGGNKKCAEPVAQNGEENGGSTDDAAKRIGFVTEVGYGQMFVTKNGDVYLKPTDYVSARSDYLNISKVVFDSSYAPGTAGKYKITSEDVGGYEFPGDTLVDEYKKEIEFDGYKLDLSDIVAVYDVDSPAHQWWGWTTLFVDKDGNTSWMRVEPNYEHVKDGKARSTFVKNYEGYKNIAAVINNGFEYGEVILITKDGGQIRAEDDKPFEK